MLESNYKEHIVFAKLTEYADFYNSLSDSILGFVSSGTTAIFNIDSYAYSSIKGTLESIRDILIKGRINDSYALLRKYNDAIIINIYTNLFLSDNLSYENFIVDKINDWVKGKERLPEYRIMSNYIRNSSKVSIITKLIYKDKSYNEIRDRCNDNTHYNYFYNHLLNDNEIYMQSRINRLNAFATDLDNLFILHFAYIFYLNEHYMSSSDYVDCLDCGLIPEEGSQYFVAHFIQEMFDRVIKKHRMDIALVIKYNTCMKLL